MFKIIMLNDDCPYVYWWPPGANGNMCCGHSDTCGREWCDEETCPLIKKNSPKNIPKKI